MRPTRQYLAELEALSANGATGDGEELLRRVVDLYFVTADRQAESDRTVFGQVMEALAYRLDARARADLAARLADADALPDGLSRRLAGETIDIARPLLERCAGITEDDLIAVAGTGTLDHIDAIARRDVLGAPLTDALIAKADDVVLLQLALKPRAVLSRQGFEIMAERARTSPDIRGALEAREDLPADIRASLFPDDEDLPAPQAASVKLRPGEEAALAQAARAGDAGSALDMLVAVTGLDRPLLETCLLRSELPALVVLCKAHRLAGATFSALLQLRLTETPLSAKSIARAMRRYDAMQPEMAQRIMRFLRVRLASPEGDGKRAGAG